MEPTNKIRAAWAEKALDVFRTETKCDRDTAVRDLLGDLMHLCHQQEDVYGNFGDELERGLDFFQEELAEENEAPETICPRCMSPNLRSYGLVLTGVSTEYIRESRSSSCRVSPYELDQLTEAEGTFYSCGACGCTFSVVDDGGPK